jgi:hypothetical protein
MHCHSYCWFGGHNRESDITIPPNSPTVCHRRLDTGLNRLRFIQQFKHGSSVLRKAMKNNKKYGFQTDRTKQASFIFVGHCRPITEESTFRINMIQLAFSFPKEKFQ